MATVSVLCMVCFFLISATETDAQGNVCPPCICGLPNRRRVVGGVRAQPHKYPWAVALFTLVQDSWRFNCGGTIINDLYILTAAHCVPRDPDISSIRVALGKADYEDILDHDTQEDLKPLSDIYVHERYEDATTTGFDIALLRLKERLKFDTDMDIDAICLPEPGDHFTGDQGVLVGWGRIFHHGPISPFLREIELKIYSKKECESFYGSDLPDATICAGSLSDTEYGGSCMGDSGGSLAVTGTGQSNRRYQAGIVSFGVECGNPQQPGVYTQVNKYVDWIQGKTKDACWCSL